MLKGDGFLWKVLRIEHVTEMRALVFSSRVSMPRIFDGSNIPRHQHGPLNLRRGSPRNSG